MQFDYYTELILSSLAPLGIVAILACSAKLRTYSSSDVDYCRGVEGFHTKLALLVSFITYPTSSSTIFEVFHCSDFDDGSSFLAIDLSKRCDTPTHAGFVIYGSLMVVFVTGGTITVFAVLLYRSRHLINPVAKDSRTKMRLREANDSLRPIRFLFNDYNPSAWWCEVVEMIRRVIMVGGLRFCGAGGLRCGVGVLFALLSIFAYREIMPYTDNHTNSLAVAAQIVVYFVYVAAFIIETKPVRFSPIWNKKSFCVTPCMSLSFAVSL